ncbi:MAG TPA: methionyl-tRNA formyltransferase [Dehalococcoidales bacterium]|nr:methionyl-tRNA formyltransferase [Dehalococcoidales bacterium]
MRIVFMGSPEFSVPSLERLAGAGYEIAAVYTQPDRPAGRGRALVPPPVKAAALSLGLKVEQPETLKSEEVINGLAQYKPEAIAVCAYGQILPKAVLEMPPLKCINVHFSLLPRHRGASPVVSTLLAGDEFAGVTIMIVTPKLDTGPVLARAAINVMSFDNAGTVTEKLGIVGADLLVNTMLGWRRGEIEPLPQDDSKSTYFSQMQKEAGAIDWTLPAETIWRQVRAYNPWPGCYTTWGGKQLKIIEAKALPDMATPGPGKVVEIQGRKDAAGIGTGKGVLAVTRLQLQGKRAVTAAEFLRGQRDFIGQQLPN